MAKEIKRLEEENAQLRFDYENLDEKCKKLEARITQTDRKVSELQKQINNQQQWARMSNLEIVGLPELPKESPINLVIEIAKHAGVTLKYEQIEFASRVQPMQSKPGRPKTLVAKLKNRELKDAILSGLRKVRGISTTDIGIGGNRRRFYVNEHLTPKNKQLFNKAKSIASDKSYKFIWVRNC
ncbi:uncharacterized protein LOC124542528 [Vanessa cardui]|uniref:uncharacterized protein LOC124542528 n=1 Tax=Vanessa cardui TaxID=171605 RepID=UPI001F138A04|nr:uncharacterized protein LOC124542528 [Vanessa cardui]